mmetsp:Transcript_21079/g.28025  ORF Transcript_21079/g.28025 Transcript_21079/m.28025 type:complete len:106 (+) Transcript_21079:170-487(+)
MHSPFCFRSQISSSMLMCFWVGFFDKSPFGPWFSDLFYVQVFSLFLLLCSHQPSFHLALSTLSFSLSAFITLLLSCNFLTVPYYTAIQAIHNAYYHLNHELPKIQ